MLYYILCSKRRPPTPFDIKQLHLVVAPSELIRSGISGIFRKHDSAGLLTQGIPEVMAGKVWLDQRTAKCAQHPRRDREALRGPTVHRTRTAAAFPKYLRGLPIRKWPIRVSEGSVKSSLQQLFSKTGVRTRSQLVRIFWNSTAIRSDDSRNTSAQDLMSCRICRLLCLDSLANERPQLC
jgi:hypothetical protein